MAYKVVRDAWAKRIAYHVVNDGTGEIKKTFTEKTAAVEYAQQLNAYGEKK